MCSHICDQIFTHFARVHQYKACRYVSKQTMACILIYKLNFCASMFLCFQLFSPFRLKTNK